MLKEVIIEIIVESIIELDIGGVPVNRVSELNSLSWLNQGKVFVCEVDLDNLQIVLK